MPAAAAPRRLRQAHPEASGLLPRNRVFLRLDDIVSRMPER
jgi:hypothetical protein